jgi:hypothetical protein
MIYSIQAARPIPARLRGLFFFSRLKLGGWTTIDDWDILCRICKVNYVEKKIEEE